MDVGKLLSRDGEFFLIAGPCVLEDESLNVRVAEAVVSVGARFGIPVIFKASFDKANRTRLSSPRGPGLEAGLELLEAVRARVDIPLTTDIHLPEQAQAVAGLVDLLQIPAFLSRQTDLIVAAAATGRPLNLKKGQWMAPEDMRHQVEKARHGGAAGVAVTERGTAFGYHNLVVDMRSFSLIRESCGCPAIFDATHSVQRPGGNGGVSGGDRRYIADLAAAAVAAGADGLFLETHPEPDQAPSDAASMLPLADLEDLIARVVGIYEARGSKAGSSDV